MMRSFKIFKDGKEHTDLEKFALTGPVKQEMQVVYKAHVQAGIVVQGKIEAGYAGGEKNYISIYDESGNEIKQENYGADAREVHLYENGHVTKKIKYNSEGQLIETVVTTYNDKGRLIDYTTRNSEGKVRYKSVHIYDEEGKTLETINYNGDAETDMRSRTVYTYNKWGKTDSIIEYNKEGGINHQSLNKFDANGNEIEHLTEWFEEYMIASSQRTVYRNNSHGDAIEMIVYKLDGTVKDTFTFSYKYDSEGNKINDHIHRDDVMFDLEPGETDKQELTDKYGNWIRRVRYHNDKPMSVYVREFVYYGDDDEKRELVHPLSEITEKKAEVTDVSNKPYPLEEAEVKWLSETPNISGDNFPVIRYYTIRFKDIPSLTTYTGSHIEAISLAEDLQKYMGAQMIHSYGTKWNGYEEGLSKYTLAFNYNPYLLQATGISSRGRDGYLIPDFIEYNFSNSVYTSQFQLLRPSDASGNRDEYFERELNEFIDRCTLEKKPAKPVVNIIETSGNSFVMKEYPVNDKFEIRDLDLNYGYGFQKFHSDLMYRFSTSTKGLVLFHGEPGTGKTYYIRHLLRSMAVNKKMVIYMPPNMVEHLVEPTFMTFLTEEIKSWSEDGNFCVMLIEDAEPLLAKRQEGVRIQGITNLLNMSDGLLNDMLNLQIICTFNVGLRKLDSALLRPGRLIARKEFKPLSELDANLLAQRIGIRHHFKGPATLGEIYAMKKDQSILIHDVDSNENSSTHVDDLI